MRNDLFGQAVAVSGDRILVGAPGSDWWLPNAGAAYLFERSRPGVTCGDDTWCLTETFYPGTAMSQAGFGVSVSLAGDRAAIGAWSDGSDGPRTGLTYLYQRNATGTLCAEGETWCPAMIAAGDGMHADYHGTAVALGGDVLVVGGPGDDDRGRDSGSAYLYALGMAYAGDIGLIETDGVRSWSDGTLAASCYEYRYPPEGYVYDGAVGDGTYRIDPDGGDAANAWSAGCVMDVAGGGWTRVASQAAVASG
jgi:hypothetical protein